MRLKSVKIFGFKTFADRTEFDLHGNMVAVVGPNGCGKSNLVDAILWGLGEGNARHLRAQSSQDVIFSGSIRRKPVGFAEVTLLFDNEDGALPVQTSEVSITRRLNRAGGSDYFINRQHCRLRDVLDLLADSGLGRAGYSIVGQKEIDQALAASPEDRREWVDEAAGVQRYRVRKAESLKRLAAARDHITRIADILSEIESQREPMREEAEVAIRYKSVLSSLKEVESSLLIVEVATAFLEISELGERIGDSIRLATAETELADRFEAEAENKRLSLLTLEAELERAREARQQNLMAIEKAEASIQLTEERIRTIQELETNLGEQASITFLAIEEAEAELEGFRKERESEESKLSAIQEECAGAGDDFKKLKQELQVIERELASAKETQIKRLKLEAELAQIGQRRQAVMREIEGIEKCLPDLRAAVQEAQGKYETLNGNGSAIERQMLVASQELQDIEKKQTVAAQEARKHLSDKAALEGRRNGIEATIAAHEGLNQGARSVLDAQAKKILPADYIPVGKALSVKKMYALAIETALGAGVNDLIVSQEEDAKRAIEYLKSNRLGRATFQPLTLIQPAVLSADVHRLFGRPGVIARASDLIDCSPEHRPVFESLLGRVLVVDCLDTGLRIARTNGWNRIVTLEGEIIYSSGAVSGGISSKTNYGLVQRKADLSQIASEIGALDLLLKEAERETNLCNAERVKIEERAGAARESLAEIQGEIRDCGQWLHDVQSELHSTERSFAKLRAEQESLPAVKSEPLPEVDLAAIEAARDVAFSTLAARSADAESATERLKEARERVEQSKNRVAIGERRLAAAHENERIRERKVFNLGPELGRAEFALKEARQQHELAAGKRERSEELVAELQVRRTGINEEIHQHLEEARKSRAHSQTCSDAAHQAEISRARIETRKAASVQRLLEEYAITEEEALVQEESIELPKDAASIVGRLRRELKAMGDVNIGAIEAYERLTERWDDLTNQREDVLGGIAQVEASIRELDKLTRERFVSTFEEVQKAFREIFRRLFGGGEGNLSLTDPGNILETGVEIDVTLPGKNRQKLELLSGGERSLCAASFLFALLRIKPSPLVVLDEVDAPLDGRNVERFIGLLQDFMAVSQFILITHNPTTIESAPVWLGVTMQEPGVSTLVPARFAPSEAIVLN